MKRVVSCAATLLFLFFLCPLAALSQETPGMEDENLKMLEAARQARLSEYGEKKAEFELQLAKLIKDRKIAANDNNSSLENKRAFEILDLRKQIKALNKEYGIDDGVSQKSESPAEVSVRKKGDAEIDADFYAKELAREKLKMEGGYIEKSRTSDVASKKKSQTVKKAAAKKKK